MNCKRCVVSRGSLRLSLCLLSAVTLLAAGCGAAARAKTANDLKVVGLMYHEYVITNAKAPEKVEDLKAHAKDAPQVYQALVDGKFVFIYGVKLTDMPAGTGSTVLGYEKDVPAKGGYVLFGDGSVSQMTAKEFQAAPKAQAKTKPAGEMK